MTVPGALDEPLPKPPRRPRRAAYALPTLFTAGNIFMGFFSLMKTFEGSLQVLNGKSGSNDSWELAALLIGFAFILDGLDGRIARMTNTASDFGREMDSLADVITFGIAPAVLGMAWGFQFHIAPPPAELGENLKTLSYFVAFSFLLCGASRLARFNVSTNPAPKNPGRADRKYFVGLPIPASAGLVAAIVYASYGTPLESIAYMVGIPPQHCWVISLIWAGLLLLLSFLMVSTWRYRSFKEVNFRQPRTPLMVIVLGLLLFLVGRYSHPMLLLITVVYTASGILTRIGGLLRRRRGVPLASAGPLSNAH